MTFEWLFSSPAGIVVLALLLALWVVAMGTRALHFKRRGAAIASAEQFLTTQHLPASQSEIEAIIRRASMSGKRDEALQLFSDLRRQFGHEGVKKGHVMWALMKIDGDLSDDAIPPSYADGVKNQEGIR